jgi:predicted deacylase
MADPHIFGNYAPAEVFETRWRELASELGGTEAIAGHSVEGRPVWRFDVGTTDASAPTILLTALIHGIEIVGSVALFEVVRSMRATGLLDNARFVIMPIMNPDAFALNMERIERGRPAARRKNARGVDLNRNFPIVANAHSWHPFSGSTWRFSPHHRGPHPLSEPESRALADVATQVHPDVALGFHSFGNLLLYPWAHTRAANPRLPRYLGLAEVFVRRLARVPYRFKQAIDFYPTIGDLDDWLDDNFKTLAFTVEVGGLDARLFHPLRFANPFCWMNPHRVDATVTNVSPAVLGLLQSFAPA